jgi:hypothetical protein
MVAAINRKELINIFFITDILSGDKFYQLVFFGGAFEGGLVVVVFEDFFSPRTKMYAAPAPESSFLPDRSLVSIGDPEII